MAQQTATAVASAYQALRAQEHQPTGADPLGPALVAITTQLQHLTAERLASEAGIAPATSAVSPAQAASLVKRIRHLRALLLRLANAEPSYARRLAPELLTLRRLLNELCSTRIQAPAPSNPASTVQAADDALGPTPVAENPAALVVAPAPMLDRYAPVAAAPRQARDSLATDFVTPRMDASASHSGPRSAAPQTSGLHTNLAAANGPSRSASASGASTGTGAGTLATRCGTYLPAGLLSGRLTLVVLPWRLAVLGHRLERPG